MENDYGKTSGVVRFIVKSLNMTAWATLSIIAIGIVIAYVTDHQITIIHNENPPAASVAAPVAAPVASPLLSLPPAAIKSGG